MEKKTPRPMTPFDEMVTPQHLQMLKLMLPYTPSSNQQFLGVFVKFLELEETITFFQSFDSSLHTQAFAGGHPPAPMELLGTLKPYMAPQEAEMMDTILNMMNMMEMVQMFQDDGESQSKGDMGNMFSGGFNPMDMMMGMLTPEQQNMFQMYNNMFANEMEDPEMESSEMESSEMKGEHLYERMDEQPGNEEYRSHQIRIDSDGSITDER